jgi:hypothetical protein
MELRASSYRTTPEQAIEIAASQGHVYPPITPSESAVRPTWSHQTKLSREELIDKIKGTIYGNYRAKLMNLEFLTDAGNLNYFFLGNAIGDAIGLCK